MLAQRGVVQSIAKAEKKATLKPAMPAPAKPASTKLSFKEQHELKQLGNEIEKLQGEMRKQETILATHDLYAKDAKKFATATAALGELHKKLEAAEERWLELEMRREG